MKQQKEINITLAQDFISFLQKEFRLDFAEKKEIKNLAEVFDKHLPDLDVKIIRQIEKHIDLDDDNVKKWQKNYTEIKKDFVGANMFWQQIKKTFLKILNQPASIPPGVLTFCQEESKVSEPEFPVKIVSLIFLCLLFSTCLVALAPSLPQELARRANAILQPVEDAPQTSEVLNNSKQKSIEEIDNNILADYIARNQEKLRLNTDQFQKTFSITKEELLGQVAGAAEAVN